jgi:hypothetical protein
MSLQCDHCQILLETDIALALPPRLLGAHSVIGTGSWVSPGDCARATMEGQPGCGGELHGVPPRRREPSPSGGRPVAGSGSGTRYVLHGCVLSRAASVLQAQPWVRRSGGTARRQKRGSVPGPGLTRQWRRRATAQAFRQVLGSVGLWPAPHRERSAPQTGNDPFKKRR